MTFNEYRIMWLMVVFDLPVSTKKDRKNYAKYRQLLLDDGFTMMQYSVYIRHCLSKENYYVHKKRIKNLMPEKGTISILNFTDKQFGMIETYNGKEKIIGKKETKQLELFE